MHIQSLNGRWSLTQVGKTESVAASVPGCVHTDLLNAGKLDDPFYRDNEKNQMWIGEADWQYYRRFTVNDELLSHDVVLLRCHGLDTLANISINGTDIASTENMFRTYEFDVKSHLTHGENVISIKFDAPATYVREQDAERGEMGSLGRANAL